MLEVKNLSKKYGKKDVLRDISFSIGKGEVVGFLGSNGAGKSTTMNIITGYLASNSGDVLVDGVNVLDDPIQAKTKIGYLPEHPPLYTDMTVEQYLNFVYSLKGLKQPRKEHIEGICRRVKIDDVYKRAIRNLSKGYCQRVGLAQALLGDPELLVLDEPTVGLDPKQMIDIRNLIRSLGETHTIILSSHILSEVQAVCNRILVIRDGKLVADGSSTDVMKSVSTENGSTLSVRGLQKTAFHILEALDGVKTVTAGEETEPGVFEFRVDAEPGRDVRDEIFFAFAEKRIPILAMRSTALSLEEAFLTLTSGKLDAVKPSAEVTSPPEVSVEPEPEQDEAKEEQA